MVFFASHGDASARHQGNAKPSNGYAFILARGPVPICPGRPAGATRLRARLRRCAAAGRAERSLVARSAALLLVQHLAGERDQRERIDGFDQEAVGAESRTAVANPARRPRRCTPRSACCSWRAAPPSARRHSSRACRGRSPPAPPVRDRSRQARPRRRDGLDLARRESRTPASRARARGSRRRRRRPGCGLDRALALIGLARARAAARRNSSAEAVRSTGSTHQRRQQRRIEGRGELGPQAGSAGSAAWACAASMSCVVTMSYGGSPVSISYAITPSA